jgi:hypothetical protein
MTKRLIDIVECVFAWGVFEGQWAGLDEVEVVESFQKQIFVFGYQKGQKHKK